MLITGASAGIGRCLAELAVERQARVVVASRNADRLSQIAKSLQSDGTTVHAFPVDLTEAEGRARLFQFVNETLDGLDILVNNAGIGSFGHFAGSSERILRRVMEVNFFAPAELTRLALPLLRRGHQPLIVNVASKCGRRGLPAWPEYSASKYAICGLTEALRAEFSRFGIDILLVLPGLTATEMGGCLLRNEGRMKIDFATGAPASKVALAILRAMEQRRAEVVIGRDARALLLVNRFFPRLVDRLIARKVKRLYAGEKQEVIASDLRTGAQPF
jgi:short-subunit dehydrogenase